MRFDIEFDPLAIDDLRPLRAYDRASILDTIERVLGAAPTQAGKSRIKRLRGMDSPQYRLRVGEFRVFYDVTGQQVYVMRILTKASTAGYLKDVADEAENSERRATGDANGKTGE
jgi:mRNA-degrading endonuclease RelE of RelBE toxin-antitoxin system